MKHYYVRNIIKPFPRDEFVEKVEEKKKELEENLKKEYEKIYEEMLLKEKYRINMKKKKEALDIKAGLKAKALGKAI